MLVMLVISLEVTLKEVACEQFCCPVQFNLYRVSVVASLCSADPGSGLSAEDTRTVKSVPVFPVLCELVGCWTDFFLINSSMLQRVI